MQDMFGRKVDYMRISITDRCNLRCKYCMPVGIAAEEQANFLTFEEILEICMAAVKIGISKFKISGGEPLVRKGCTEFIARLSKINGVKQVTMTTNGVLLEHFIDGLVEGGLTAVNISLDSLKSDVYQEITGANVLKNVRRGIDRAIQTGIPVKLNCVPQKNINENECIQILELAKNLPIDVRLIEMMPIGIGKKFESIPNEKILGEFSRKYPGLQPDLKVHGNGPAKYFKVPGFQGSIGIISAVHGNFCSECNRIRLTSDGKLKSCLSYRGSIDLRKLLRMKEYIVREQALEAALQMAVLKKPSRHCFDKMTQNAEVSQMVKIGG